MFRAIIISFFVTQLFFGHTSLTAAQSISFYDPTKPADQQEVAGNLACFDYYKFGSVTADLQAIIKQTIPGSEIAFGGTVVNENSYPIMDGTLVARIFKRDEKVFAAADGNPVVDQFVIAKDITIKANGSIPMEYVWRVPASAEGGDYYAAYFFVTNERYNLMGLSFTDDIVGNQANFTITNPNDSTVAKFDKTSVKINDQDHRFASFPLQFGRNDEVTITALISNPTDKAKTIPVQWSQFAWDGRLESNQRNTVTKLVTLAPNETKEIEYEVIGQREPIAFVTAVAEDAQTKSILNIRFVRDGIEETRINFPSLTAFPLAKGQAQTVFACAHSTSLPVVPGNLLTLTLTDKDGSTIHQYQYEGDITAAMGGFGDVFTPEKNYNQVTLEAALVRNGVEIERVTINYDCNQIDASSCLPEDSEDDKNGFFDSLMQNKVLVILGGVILLLIISLGLFFSRRGPTIVAMLALIVLGGALAVPGGTAEAAKTTQWQMATTTIPNLTSYAQSSDFCWKPGASFCDSGNPDTYDFTPGGYVIPYKWVPTGTLRSPSVRIERGSTMTDGVGNTLSDGDSVTVGQEVRVIPRVNSGTDITWFGTGSYQDSPYGNWSNSPSVSCNAGDFLSSNSIIGVNFDSYVALNVSPTTPVISHSGTAGLSCNGDNSICSVTTPGTIVATVTWPATTGLFAYSFNRGPGIINPYSADWFNPGCTNSSPFKDNSGACAFNSTNSNALDCLDTHPDYSLPVSAMSITHSVSATAAANNPPNLPSFTGPPTAQTNTLVPWTAVATDPDGNQIYYRFDWNNDGLVDGRLPSSPGMVNSGSPVNSSRIESATGTYSYKAQACDALVCSGWATYTLNVTAPPLSCSVDYVRTCVGGRCRLGGNGSSLLAPGVSAVSARAETIIDVTVNGVIGRFSTNCGLYDSEPLDGPGACSVTQSITHQGQSLSLRLDAVNRTPDAYTSNLAAAAWVTGCSAALATADLRINNQHVGVVADVGDTLTLDWEASNVSSCALYGPGFPGTPVALTGSITTSASISNDYILNCVGATPDVVDVTVNNLGPDAPTINGVYGGSTSGIPGQNLTFTMQSIDPEGDQLVYEIDWNSDGVAENTSGPQNSAFFWDQSNSWASGPVTIRARAMEISGAKASAWTTHTVNISAPPAPTATLQASVNGDTPSTADRTVNPSDSVELEWSSSNANLGCSATAGTGFTASGQGGTDTVTTPAPGTAETFTIKCDGVGGSDTKSITITTNQLPNFITPTLSTPTLGPADPITGIYSYVDFTFQNLNNGGSPTTINSGYRFEFDRENNGSYDVNTTGPLGTFAVGASENSTERVTNVSLGNGRIRITADQANVISETNEGDNVLTLDYTIPPPTPGIDLTATPTQVRDGGVVTLNWTRTSVYPMTCAVFGPGINLTNVTFPGTTPTGALTAKSQFTLRCVEPITGAVFTDTVTVETQGQIEEI